MSDLDALLAGIVADPLNELRWLVLADWLDEFDDPRRAELLRLHRMLLSTCCEPDAHPERAEWHARIVDLIDDGVTPCVPQHTLVLPGNVPLVGNFIPPGSFLMGSNDGEEYEQPIHKVTLTKGFFMGSYPVTQAQGKAVTGADTSDYVGVSHPVDDADWNAATAFCDKLAKLTGQAIRLPTEAEWEYACRSGTTTRFHWGDVTSWNRMNSSPSESRNGLEQRRVRNGTTAVDTFAANSWGLFDCHGNVHEWCQDWLHPDFDVRLPELDPVCLDSNCGTRVLRGGAFYCSPHFCTAASRHGNPPGDAPCTYGFRVAFTLS